VSKVGIEHQKAINSGNKNTLGTFYNWCLSKSTRYNVFKWDADFICIRNNFIQLTEIYNLRNRDDIFAIWFTGKTLFEDKNNYYLNYNSFYNEFRIFSYKNNFCWHDGNICEYTDPYINICPENKKYKYEYPLFFEIKRTSIDEFNERSSLIDQRDINDFNILNNLKKNSDEMVNLIYLDKKYINYDINLSNTQKTIFIYTPSLSWGGGNQFIINIYIILKTLGFKIFLFPMDNKNVSDQKFNKIINNDIYNLSDFNIPFIKTNKPQFILFNSSIPFYDLSDISESSKSFNLNTKIIFITHSDVAFANSFIEKYHKNIYKILTVNDYTINKLNNLIPEQTLNKYKKIINYTNIIKNDNNKKIVKNYKKFGVISRFSEDKNIPMFLFSLIDVFNKYNDYKCYLIGSNNEKYDNYLKYLIKIFNLEKYVQFEGYQENILKYYEKIDFIVLPSVSEGCSYNILEAMSLGLPVITSNVGGNHELIINKINGILYNYEGIRDYEKSKVYIHNYNEHLSIIGYFEINKLYPDKYIIDNLISEYSDKIEVIMPHYISCKKHNHTINARCDICKSIKRKNDIFNSNKNNITSSILEMINLDSNSIINIQKNNIDFIKNKFNENTYLDQILDIFL
jgi:glycosyltransferase involved in cell wall biosynthesis